MGCIELLSQFDPFLADHLNRSGNAGNGNPSYLFATICNEFIDITGKHVSKKILSEVREAKYYSISVDSTPCQSINFYNPIFEKWRTTGKIFEVYPHTRT